MLVLGIHHGHDSSAALVKDGRIIADVQEERFSRVKHSSNPPLKSIAFCLQQAGVKDINEIDQFCFTSEEPPGKELSAIFGLEDSSFKGKLKKRVKDILAMPQMKLPIYFPDYQIPDKTKFLRFNHHLAHAASAYFTRKTNDRCLIFTVDGMGDNICTAVWIGEGDTIELQQRYFREASIGWAYSVVTEGLHWIHGDGEGKTMGLAPYGDPAKCHGVLDQYFPAFKDDQLVKPSKLGQNYFWLENGSYQYHFDEAKEVEQLIARYGREHIAAEAQRKLEECVMNLVFGWIKKTGIKKTAFAGGVMLNVKLNQRIWNNRRDLVEEQHVYPNPGDSGLAVGAALLGYHQKQPFHGYQLDHLYQGPSYSNEEIEAVLRVRKLNYHYTEEPSKKAAELLADNKIVAWFQGRMESGPRALGNRSILMSPLKAENKNTINAWVKFREGFRPFCPSLLYEKRHEYLQDCREELFMITSFDIQEDKRELIPAVVHVDGTVRPQMVQKETNPRYWELINEFGNLTGEYIILNTSFNIMGEPIINHPKEAVRCFFDSGLDALFMGNYYLTKETAHAPLALEVEEVGQIKTD